MCLDLDLWRKRLIDVVQVIDYIISDASMFLAHIQDKFLK